MTRRRPRERPAGARRTPSAPGSASPSPPPAEGVPLASCLSPLAPRDGRVPEADFMAGRDLAQRRLFAPAFLAREGTARGEAAAGRRREGVRHLALDRRQSFDLP